MGCSACVRERRRGYTRGMTAESEANRPNEYGFGGEATGPEPQPATEDQPRPGDEAGEDPVRRAERDDRAGGVDGAHRIEPVDGESIAVPAGDITGAITDAINDVVENRPDPDESDEDRER